MFLSMSSSCSYFIADTLVRYVKYSLFNNLLILQNNLQSLAKPTTPERTENCYIVESLSPNSSPRKPHNVSKPASEVQKKSEREKRNKIILHRDRSQIKDLISRKCIDVKKRNSKEENEKKSRSDKNLRNDPVHSVPKLTSILKEEIIQRTKVEERLQNSEKTYGPYEGSKSSYLKQSTEKVPPEKMCEQYKCKDAENPSLIRDRNETMFRRCKLDVPIVCGAASLRMEQLKKQLREDRHKKSQRPQSDWPEYSSGKEWQINLSKQRNSVVEEIRHTNIPLHTSCPDSRKKYFSNLGNEPLRSGPVASFPSRSYSQNTLSGSLPKPYFSEGHGKPYFIRDYCHSRSYNDTTFPSRKYSESASRAVVDDPIKFHSTLIAEKPFSKFTPGRNCSLPNFDKRAVSNPYNQTGSSQLSSCNLLQKYYVPDKEYKGNIIDRKKYYLPESERNFYPKPEISSLMRTKPATQLVKYNQVFPHEPLNNTGLVKDKSYSLEPGRRNLPDTYISKTSAMDRLRHYKLLLLQANALRNQHPADYSHSYKFNSDIGPFASSSEALFSGRKCDTETARDIRGGNITQRKPIDNVNFKMPTNYSTSLKNLEKDVEADCTGNEVVHYSWQWGSQGFVRDYNHKSISDCNRKNTEIFGNRVTYEKQIAECKLKLGSASEEKQIRKRISTPDESGPSTSFSKSSRHCHPSSYQEKSARNEGRLLSPRKTVLPVCSMKKNFGQSERELVFRAKDDTSAQISSEVGYLLSSSNKNPNTIEQNKNSHNNSTLLQKIFKHKSQDSKGGISKINRRVQKQLRTAAPKLIHLPSACVNNILESSPQPKKVDQNCKPVDAVKYIEEEEMDWEPIEPEKVVMQVEALRKGGGFQNNVNPELENLCNMDTEVSSQWFVILDTNVLLSHLTFLLGLRDMKDDELGMPTLFIPWVVLQELDHLKSSNRKVALENYARRAINFIYDNLLNKHPRVGGQPKAEADESDSLEPDDSILQCCLNLQKCSSKVLLLTNDRNLFNKAVINRVECCSAPKLMQELENRRKLSTTSSTSTVSVLNECKHPFQNTIQTLKECVGVVLEELLRTEMVLVYDRQWSEIVARKPPWTLNDVLFCLLKHWVAVFRLVLPCAARELIEKIRTFVNNEVYETSVESVESIVKTCISLMHLISSLSYKQYVDKALKTLSELQRSLKAQKKLSSSTSTFAVSGKAGNTLKNVPATSLLNDSDTVSVISKGEQHAPSVGIGVDRENCDGSSSSSIDDSKVDADDCLSLFASSFSEDTGNNQLSDSCVERGQELTHKYLNKIWEKIAVYCGMLCDVMGVEPCVPYQPPEPFPAVETLHQNMLSFVKCVSTLLRCMEGILFTQPNELQENSHILLNFYTAIKESLPTWNELGEALLPQHVLVYCTQTDTRLQLEHGKKQFEQFEAVLNRAVTFFMGQNQSFSSLPSF